MEDGRTVNDGRAEGGRLEDKHAGDGRLGDARLADGRLADARLADARTGPDGRAGQARMAPGLAAREGMGQTCSRAAGQLHTGQAAPGQNGLGQNGLGQNEPWQSAFGPGGLAPKQRSAPRPRNGAAVVLLSLSNLLLLAALVFWFFYIFPFEAALPSGAQGAPGSEAGAGAPPATRADVIEELMAEGWADPASVKRYAAEFNLSTEVISRFFPENIVYKDAGAILYADIDPDLRRHPYDWSRLSWNGRRPSYEGDGGAPALLGIDVSRYQGDIDWAMVAADGIGFAMIRMGYRGYGTGAVNVDEYFEANMRGAAAAGVRKGVYFFSQAVTVEEAVEEADTVISAVAGFDVEFPIVFDMEDASGDKARTDTLSKAQVTEIAAAFCERVRAAGHTPMVYANPKWFVSRMELGALEGYDKWLAQYYATPAYPYAFTIWQFSNTGSVAGISGDVDMNLAFTDYSGA